MCLWHWFASMRPGPIGPGNPASGGRVARESSGFNEARPNWAGKSFQVTPNRRAVTGFNEARPNWAGKWVVLPRLLPFAALLQ